MSMERKLAAGVDYGSDSVRVLLVEMENGNAVSGLGEARDEG